MGSMVSPSYPVALIWRARKQVYLVKALKDFKTGERKNEMMSVLAPDLSDQDIDDLAAYYSSIPVTVGPPPQ